MIGYIATTQHAFAGTAPGQFDIHIKDEHGSGVSDIPVTFTSTHHSATADRDNYTYHGYCDSSTSPGAVSFFIFPIYVTSSSQQAAAWNYTTIAGYTHTLSQNSLSDGYVGSYWGMNQYPTPNPHTWGFNCGCNNLMASLDFSGTSNFKNYKITSVTDRRSELVPDPSSPFGYSYVWSDVPVSHDDNTFNYPENNDSGDDLTVTIEPKPTGTFNSSCSTGNAVLSGTAEDPGDPTWYPTVDIYDGAFNGNYNNVVKGGITTSGSSYSFSYSLTQAQLQSLSGHTLYAYAHQRDNTAYDIGHTMIDCSTAVTNSCPNLTVTPTSVKQGNPVTLSWSGGENIQSMDINQIPSGGSEALVYKISSGSPLISVVDGSSTGSIDVVPSITTDYFLSVIFKNGVVDTTCSTSIDTNTTKKHVIVRPPNSGGSNPVAP